MFIANISPFLAVNLLTGGAFMNSSGKCVLFLDAPALHKHVDMCRASKCWGETWLIFGPVASSDRRGKVKLVSVQRWKDICLGVPVALSKVSIFLWNFLKRFRHSSNPIMNTESKQQELPAHLMGLNLAPESWNIPVIPSRVRAGSVRRSWQLTTRSLLSLDSSFSSLDSSFSFLLLHFRDSSLLSSSLENSFSFSVPSLDLSF